MSKNGTTTTTTPANVHASVLPEAFPLALEQAIKTTAASKTESALPAGSETRAGRRMLLGGADVGGFPADAPALILAHVKTGRRDLAHVAALAKREGSRAEAFPYAGGFLVVAVGAASKNAPAPVEYAWING